MRRLTSTSPCMHACPKHLYVQRLAAVSNGQPVAALSSATGSADRMAPWGHITA